MNKKLSVLRRITAVVLCVTLLSSQVVVANAEDSERMNVQTNSEITDISEQDGFSSDTSEISDITESDIPDSFEGESEPNTDISSEVTEEFGNSKDQGFTDGEETIIEDENTSDTLEEANPDYEDGKICIYNYQQLLQIGTGTQMFSGDKDGNVGEGDKVLADGAELTYASDASYCLMNDIPIDNENVWNFPSDFTGSITSSSERTGNTVYDSVTDTIYVYNRYQLELMKGKSSDSEPVMSEDYIAEKVGMGQVFTLEDGSYLTYSKTHNYVLASSFTTETPELLANKAGTEETTQDITSAYPSDYEGRNYFGQVVKKIGDKNYILIGNETQLRAIGTDTDVTEPIWRVYETREKNEGILGGYTDWKPAADTSEYKTVLYYPGDADIVKFNDTYNWSGKELYANKNGAHKLNDTEYLDNPSWDIAGTKATQCYVYVSSTIQESADMTVTATESTASDSEAASVEADETVNDSDLIDMIPSDSEEAAETGSDDAEAFTSSGDESGFTDDIDSESITVDENKTYVLTYDTSKHSNTNIAGSGYKYSKDANYIIFRDIDLSKEGTNSNGKDDNWTPIKNFQGNMEGCKGMTEGANVKISNVKIVQDTAINQSAYSNGSSSDTEYGVGFFRSLSTPYDSSLQISSKQVVVKNLTLSGVSVSTTTNSIKKDFSLLGVVLTGVLKVLGLSSGLEKDPKSFSTGAFAGVVKGNVQILDCHVEGLSGVSNANSWTGGFVGYISGITKYEALSGVLKGVTDALSTLLNLIPVLGLGDLITTLLNGGVLSVGNLIPIGYVNPVFSNCSVSGNDMISGQNYTGGFAGETIGAVMTGCSVNGTESVNGTDYSGGFIGRASNAVVAGALDHLGIQIADFPVNTVMLGCSINGSANVSATGSSGKESGYAGGFIGEMRNSYAVDCSISSLGTVSGKDYTGGFAGLATLGAVTSIDENKGLLDLVKKLLTGLLNGNITDMDILNLVGLRPSVISGCTIGGSTISLDASGKYAGGLVGYAGAVQVSNTSELADGSKSTTKALNRMLAKNSISYSFNEHSNSITASESMSVSATENAGGILGYAKMTSVSDVLGGTVTAADYMRFECKDCSVNGGSLGLTVTASDKENGRAGGAIGYGTGGEVRKISVTNLNSVTAGKCAGGFAGYFGSGTLANVGGIKLLGLPLLKIDSLLSVGQMIETFTVDSTVSGVSSGYSVFTGNEKGYSGGFIGECISGRARDTKISNLKTVTASATSGKAGGFAGFAKAGDALSAGDSTTSKLTGIELENLLGVVSALRPEFNNTSIAYVSNGSDPQVSADMAGGFVGDGQAVDINYGNNNSGFKADTNSEDGTTEGEAGAIATTNITGLSYIKGTSYAGGFAGRLMPGDVAQTGSIKLLGLLDVNQLLSVMDVAYPRISDSSIEGNNLVVTASGKNDDVALGDAGGYIGNGKAVMVKNSDVTNVKEVTAPYHAGGYIGIMRSGSAAEAGDATGDLLNSVLGKILSLKELASVLQVASSKITNCKVAGTADGLTVTADNGFENAEGYAGGFVGEMQSGHVDNSANAVDSGKGTAVENLLKVEGLRYAGGFGGLVKAGAVAEIGAKSSILTKLVDLTGLLSLVNAFVPVISNASVNSVEKGFTVTVTGTLEKDSTNDADAGSAGGFIGCGTGVQISNSDVNKLQHTGVREPKNLQQEDGSSYYGSDSAYAASGYRYAGGYIGKAAMGSTAAIGGASVLDHVLSATNLLSALTVVASIIDSSDVYGAIGGFNVLATDGDGDTGKAGGYAGELLGVQIQNSNSYNFAHIIGRESAGGYVGTMEPGSAADVVDGLSALGGLIKADNLLGVLQAFVPVIKNSETTCVPCGGAVRAQAESDDGIYRGLAGGYAGYNYGGQIWGNNTDNWKGAAYTGTVRECAAYRIRSVYGTEYAGGYTGLMRCANVADTGSLKVLFGLIKLDNPLTLLQAVYPTEKNTAVYGPLRGLDTDTWNKWVGAVGSYGSYGNKLQALGEVNDQEQLNEIISQYAYGYAVTAGRSILASKATQGGSAGGYVGRMEGGTITNGTATDLQLAEAYRSSGGFAGEMLTGSVANTGGVSLEDLKIIGADSLAALKTFVPVVKQSHVKGYRSGARIKATGIADKDPAGFAGGYVGRMIGGQIWGDETSSCSITNLRRVDGTSYVGGFAGKVDPGSVAAIDTATKQGLLNKLLDVLMVNAPAELIKVLNATVSTIRCASVSAWDDWGVIVNGTYQNGNNTGYAKAAGGFTGSLCGAVLGEKDKPESGIRADKIRSVVAGEYAGGCFGIADVSGAANISANGETSVLQYLLKLGKTDVLDAFRSYVYYGNVTGSPDAGLGVSANTATDAGQNNQVTYSGTAGGFGGSLLNGSVKNSTVTGLNYVTGLNSVGGFVGYSGKSGVIKMEKLDVLGDKFGQLLGGALGVLDIFGSHIDDSSVTGVPGGYTVLSKGGQEQIAGGFIGYANLARMSGCSAGDAKNQENSLKLVESGGTAGGFAGRTSFAYLADVKLDSTVVDALFVVLDQLVRALYLDKIQDSDLLHINLGIVKVDALYDGNLIHVNLLGLDISVGLSKKSDDNNQQTDFAIIKIGDSSIKLPCDKNGIITKDNDVKSNISVNLIKANRTKITDSNVYGINTGYDVYAGGAGNDADGSANDGRSGGFVGYNDEGLLKNNNMYYCDVVRGTSKLVGPFSGKSDLDSVYDFNTKAGVEGENNNYRIYRKPAISFDEIKKNSKLLTDTFSQENGWSIFSVKHVVQVDEYNTLQNAVMATKDSSETADLNAYVSDAKAVLMSDTKTTVNTGDSTSPEPSDAQDPCDEYINLTINKVWKDFRNMDNIRPDTIKITISRSWTDAEGTKHTEVVPNYENYEIKGDISKSTWQKVIETLPAYIKDDAGTPHYYKYSVTETEIKGYTTTIETSKDGFTFTIINRHFALLPDTGGEGIMMFIIAGGLLLAFLLYTGRRRKRKQTM
ncbi:Cna B-type domain-containing protein [Dorea longicatena]|mgnify:CR=1 FL=1|uniref:Cna B-type domain-containing protein n=1 Tax=Dorea longicatena TaxID=88431 RepID=A0A414T2N3_9FIRM|nr:Cna B-type domain-containing protein [Dorea longicatena]RHG28466.1 Cna B-type domain-containing protein [Dorea longicatena]